jgi:hypothetical protein
MRAQRATHTRVDARRDRVRKLRRRTLAQRLRCEDAMSDRVRVSPSVRGSVSADGLVLLDVRGGLLLAANPIGARIWQLVERDLAPIEIAREIAAVYDVSFDRARADVDAFLRALADRGLVTEVS